MASASSVVSPSLSKIISQINWKIPNPNRKRSWGRLRCPRSSVILGLNQSPICPFGHGEMAWSRRNSREPASLFFARRLKSLNFAFRGHLSLDSDSEGSVMRRRRRYIGFFVPALRAIDLLSSRLRPRRRFNSFTLPFVYSWLYAVYLAKFQFSLIFLLAYSSFSSLY